jgi:electron transport complex protein RnfB
VDNSKTLIPTGKYIARIIEEECIGCTICIKACPFDAIIGAPKHMHTVIRSYCTGCKLCLPPCPVDCIELDENREFINASKTFSKTQLTKVKKAFAIFSRENKKHHEQRLENIKKAKQATFERKKKELLKR